MSSLVESRRDNDAVADCSTRSATMSSGRHGRLPQMTRPHAGVMCGPAPSAAYRLGASSSATETDDDVDAAVQQRGPWSSLCHNDASSSPRLSLKADFAEHIDVDQPSTGPYNDVRLATSAPNNIANVELQTGSGYSGSRNMLTTDHNASGEVRSWSADTALNSVEVRCVDDDPRRRDDCHLPTDGAVDVATDKEAAGNWNSERKIVFDIKPSEQTVDARCQPHVGDSAQRCNGRMTDVDYSAAGRTLTPKPEMTEAMNMDKSLSGRTDVKLEAYVDKSPTNGSEGHIASVTSSHFRPSTTSSTSLSEESQSHATSTSSGTQHKSYGGAGISDVISGKTAAGARGFDRTSTKNLYALYKLHLL